MQDLASMTEYGQELDDVDVDEVRAYAMCDANM
jgi:hypothetical protein